MHPLRLLTLIAIATVPSLHAEDKKPDISPEGKKFQKECVRLVDEWYPKTVRLLGAKGVPSRSEIEVIIDPEYDGVAFAAGTKIHVSEKWTKEHPDDVGLIVHEGTHVAQSYPNYDPVWLVEGIADYVRWFVYEPENKRPHPDPARAKYDNSYQVSGAFLDWLVRKKDKDIIKTLNTALKENKYSPDIFKKETGKTLDELNEEWLESLRKG